MNKRPKGRRLAVALPPKWPRWGSLGLGTITTAAYAGALLGYAYFSGEEYSPGRTAIYGVVAGGFTLVCIVGWVGTFLPWLLAGDTSVEISREPVSPGQQLDYYILQARDHSSIRRFESTLCCRRQKYHEPVENLVSVRLAAPELDPHGRRAIVRGVLQMPDGPPSSLPPDHIKVQWLIEVRVTFGKYRFKEEFPLRVVASNEKPPAGA